MVLENKKGNLFKLWYFIVIFNVFIAFAFTVLIGLNNVASTEIIEPIHDVTLELAEDSGVSDQMQQYITDSRDAYYESTIPWDIVMFGVMMDFYFMLIMGAIQTRKANPFIFFSILTFGSIFFLFLISISVEVQEWILIELYGSVFEDTSISTPIMDWVFANIGVQSFIVALVLLVINQFDRLKLLVLNLGGSNE